MGEFNTVIWPSRRPTRAEIDRRVAHVMRGPPPLRLAQVRREVERLARTALPATFAQLRRPRIEQPRT